MSLRHQTTAGVLPSPNPTHRYQKDTVISGSTSYSCLGRTSRISQTGRSAHASLPTLEGEQTVAMLLVNVVAPHVNKPK